MRTPALLGSAASQPQYEGSTTLEPVEESAHVQEGLSCPDLSKAPAARAGAISIADLPITQLVSTYTDTNVATWTMPSDAGFLLTGITDDNGNSNSRH
ncbi:MAG: hypothetical protein CMJ90_07370, partial [Planctomycetes bacterium]|nr:hypothetical protein [Planctomycetota bacterium]